MSLKKPIIGSFRRIVIVYLFFCVAIFLFGIWVQQKTYGFFNADASTVILSPYGFIDEQGGDYTYRSFQKGEEEGIHTYRFPLNQIDISRLEGDHLGLIFYRLNSQGFEVYIDDSFVGAIGDLTGGRSNLWSSMLGLQFSRAVFDSGKELVIQARHKYSKGSAYPILITDLNRYNKMMTWKTLFSEGLTLTSISAAFISSFILVYLLFSLNIVNTQIKERYKYLSVFFSIFFICIYSLDYLTLVWLPFSYLTYKKIVVVSLYLTAFFGSRMVHLQFGIRDKLRLSWIALGGIGAAAVIIQDILSFKKFYNAWNVFLILLFVYWIGVFIKNLKKDKTVASIFLIGASFMLLFSANLVLITYNDYFNALSISPSLILLLYFSTVIFLIIIEISKHKAWLRMENQKLEQLYFHSIRDQKTGVYTSEYVKQILERTDDFPSTVCMFDVDDFKRINDTYGHFEGDKALVFMADILKNELRKEDTIGRFGGDEFIILFNGKKREEAARIMQRIAERIRPAPGALYTITISTGLYEIVGEEATHQILEKVDSALYKAKQNGKDRIEIYE